MINYSYADDMLVAGNRDLLITDGTVTVSGTSYSVTGATVTITNELLDQEAFELHQSLNSSSQLTFGSCEASSISFVIHDNIPTLKGKTLKVYLIPNSDASKMLQIGVFKVEEDKLSADRTRRNITAYDALYEVINSDVAGWYNTTLPSASSSMTLAQFRAAFLSHFSITAESKTLVNDSITITRTIEPEQLSGADVIKAICEINGCFGKITNEGKFRFVELATDIDNGLFPAEDLYPADDLYPEDIDPNTGFITQSIYTDIQFEDYQSAAITQLTIRTDDEDVGVTVGTSGNRYVITGNFLVFGYNATALTSVATNALTKMSNRPYTPCTVNAMGNPVLETGDPIRVNTKYRGFLSYILERKLSGIQALRDTYTVQFFEDLEKGEPISLLVAPSFPANYPETYAKVFGKLKELGVNRIISVSFGADITTWGYIKYIQEHDFYGGISQPCPAVVGYIERYMPELLPKLFPVQSPLMCAAIYARKELGITDRLAFISPCIAKKLEIDDPNNHGVVSYNVTFTHLMDHVEKHKLYGEPCQDEIEYGLGSIYPMPGGLKDKFMFDKELGAREYHQASALK